MGLLKDDELVDIDILDVGFAAVSPSIGSEIMLEVSNGCIPETPCGMSPNVKWREESVCIAEGNVVLSNPINIYFISNFCQNVCCRNLTSAVEKTILEGRLNDAELRLELQNVQLEFATIKARNAEIRTLVDQLQVTDALGNL